MNTLAPTEAKLQRKQTLSYLLRESLVRGYTEPFVLARLKSLPLWKRLIFPFPHALRSRAWMVVFAVRAYSQGYVHPKFQGEMAVTAQASAEKKAEGTILPNFIIKELERLSSIEQSLYPNQDLLSKFHSYDVPVDSAPGNVYATVRRRILKKQYNVVIVIPWLNHGGADKGILQYCSYYKQMKMSVLLITTLPSHSNWLDKVDADIERVELGLIAEHLWAEDQEILLCRLLLDLDVEIVHCIQSDLCYRVFTAYGRQLRELGRRLIASVFCHEHDPNGLIYGYPQAYFPKLRAYLDRVICDSSEFCEDIIQRYALERSRVHFVPFFVESEVGFMYHQGKIDSRKCKKILWAGRLSYQKAPDLLHCVAKATPDVEYHVHGSVEQSALRQYRELQRLPNVVIHEKFESFFGLLASDHYDALLYTSRFDGTPNIILESAACRLPVIAPVSVGGIGSLINENTGFSYLDHESVAQCVAAVRAALSSDERAKRASDRLYELVRDRHSLGSFMGAMSNALHGDSVCAREFVALK